MRLKPISEQVVVIVGASSGIGRAASLRFAERGARVVVAARGEPGLRSLVEEIRADGGDATAVTVDAGEFEQVQSLADEAARIYGRIDTWVHLAAVSIWATFEQTKPEEWDRIISVNLSGQAYGAMAALPHLRRAGGGSLIHVSSGEAKVAFPLQSAYSASKHGMNGFLKALRLEMRKEGAPINVVEVLPAGINTPYFDKARTRIGVKPRPLPPMYQPHLVADAILYAAENPAAELVVGGNIKGSIALQCAVPRLLDGLLMAFGFRGQMTDEPKGDNAPTNLFEPLPGYDRIHGDFDREARGTSLTAWLATHAAARRAIAATVGVAGLLAVRALTRK